MGRLDIRIFEGPEAPELLRATQELRHAVFAERFGWVARSPDGREADRLDDAPGCVHVALLAFGRVVATCRLLPLPGPSLLQDSFSGIGEAWPDGAGLEASRFAVDHMSLRSVARAGGPSVDDAVRALLRTIMYVAVERGVDRIHAVTDTQFERKLQRIGLEPARIGRELPQPDCTAIAGWIPATLEAVARLCAGRGDLRSVAA